MLNTTDKFIVSRAGVNKKISATDVAFSLYQGNGSRGTKTIIYHGTPDLYYYSNGYVHVRTPYRTNANDMFYITVEFYNYYPPNHGVVTFSGYARSTGVIIHQVESYTGTGNLSEVNSYVGLDGYVYLRFKPDFRISYNGFHILSMFVGNGYKVAPYSASMVFSQFDEIQEDTTLPISTGNRTALIGITADAGVLISGYDDPTKLINGLRQNDTYFSSGSSGALTLDFNTPYRITGVSLRGHNQTVMPDVTFEYSTDNATWVAIATKDMKVNDAVDLSSDNTGLGRYFRLSCASWSASPWLYELSFRGETV